MVRVALDDTRPDRIALREELEFVDGYLEIQRTRFGDRLTIRRDIDAEVRKAVTGVLEHLGGIEQGL